MNNDLITLIGKYLNGEATESEKEVVDTLYLLCESNPGLTDQIGPEEAANAMTGSFALLSGKLDLH